MTRLKLFFIILIINTLIVLIYLLCNFLWNRLLWKKKGKKKKRRSYINRAYVMLLCPVAGPCFFFFSFLFYLLFYLSPVDLEDVVFSKDRTRAFVHAEEERERNLVPLEEAIEITETEDLRILMMNVVRGDIRKSLATIALALNSEDTETAHYAASVLQDALSEFRINVRKQYLYIQKKEEDWLECAGVLIEYMNQVLEQKVFTDLEQRDYVRQLDEICEILYEEGQRHMKSSYYEAVSLRLLETENYERCEVWCIRAAVQYPNTLATYSCLLKLYFADGQKEKFFETMEELKHSSVVIDRETLELIRIFQT